MQQGDATFGRVADPKAVDSRTGIRHALLASGWGFQSACLKRVVGLGSIFGHFQENLSKCLAITAISQALN